MKKLWTNIVIIFGFFLLFVCLVGAVLVVASGTELLGVSYIRSTSGKIESRGSVEHATDFEKICISTDNIPVTIKFVQSYSLTAYLLEEYDGFISAGEEPNVDITTSQSVIYVKSVDYKPFLLYSRTEESGLLVKIPTYYHGNIEIESKSSNINISGLEAEIGDLKISTSGSVSFNNSMVVPHLLLNVGNKKVVINENVDIGGIIEINSKNADITIPTEFKGSLRVNSRGGALHLGQCERLEYSSTSGKVIPNGDVSPKVLGNCNIKTSGKVVVGDVYGDANISTKFGKVNIGNTEGVYSGKFAVVSTFGKITMLGEYINSSNTISTKYGNITAGSFGGVSVTTKTADFTATSVGDLSVETKSGDITVDSITKCAKITTSKGNVCLGTKDGVVEEVSATTRSGNIVITNAVGRNYELNTSSGDVTYEQNKKYTSKLQVVSNKGNVSATELTGKTYIKSNGEINVHIRKMNGVEIIGGSKTVKAHTETSCHYKLQSKARFSRVPGLESATKEYSSMGDLIVEDSKTLKITTTHGEIIVTKS